MRSGSRTGVVTVIAAVLAVWLACAGSAPADPPGDNPAPYINSLSPTAAATGGPAFTLTVTGLGFVAASQVRWNGEARPTVFVSATQLQAQIAAGDVASDQTAAVSVFNPAPGGGASSPASFRVAPLSPVPEITGLSPAQAMAGDGAFGITVIGSGFVPGSTVLWNGEDRTTGYVNGFMLAATIRASDVAEAGTAYVSVANPAPGGGQSLEARIFTIVHPAPTLTSVSGLTGVWHRTTVTFSLVATDVGRGVWKTFYRIGETGDYKDGATVRVPAPADHSRDGLHAVRFYSVDEALNWEQPKQVSVGIDTRPPKTYVVSGAVKAGATLRARYRVDDALSRRALDATLRITDKAGRVVLRCDLGRPPTRTWRTAAGCKVNLPPGTYTMRVLAHDLAGNPQSGTRSGTLKVY